MKLADKDTMTKSYMQDNNSFADIFNFYLYDGEEVIKPEELRPLDTSKVVLPFADDNKPKPIQRYRDVMKLLVAMEDNNAAYVLLGIENQSDVHYAMPVRNMLYDAIEYSNQVEAFARKHREADTTAEFLSGIHRGDKLLPVITLTILWNPGEWDGARTLHDMLAVRDEKLLRFIPDYRLNLIAPRDIQNNDFIKFKTELGAALKYVKYSKDKAELDKMLHEDAVYRSISRRTADMINVITNSNISYDKGKEKVDMCKAIEDMRNDAREEGMKEGMKEGAFSMLAGLVKKGMLTITQAAAEAGMTVPEFQTKTGINL